MRPQESEMGGLYAHLALNYKKEKRMSALLETLEQKKQAYVEPFPSSRKIYVQGSREDIRVGMREIELSDTPLSDGSFEPNPPLTVYDTSGPYTDPEVEIDFNQGLSPLQMD
jgi:phosphomethylpyrimidine synthase